MKVLVKTKSENVVLVLPGTRDFIDSHRYRVFDNISDMERWETRGLIERHFLKEEATDDVFLSLFRKEGDKAISTFIKRYSLSSKAEPEEPKTEEIEKERFVEEKINNQKSTKSYKRR